MIEVLQPAAATRTNLYERLFSQSKHATRRLASVDSFRAITVLLMIFVNDLWSLNHVPTWLGHAQRSEDRLGMADTVFPAFLFIVGLSIPMAMHAREAKGYTRKQTLLHILSRSFALLAMGIFQVNLEFYDSAAALLPQPWWQIGITVGFFLVWLNYPPSMDAQKKWWLKIVGVLLLAAMAVLFRGIHNGHHIWMQTGWFGILGLIGWSYAICATVYLLAGDKLGLLTAAFVFFFLFNLTSNMGWLPFLDFFSNNVDNGAIMAFTMAGILCSALYRQVTGEGQTSQGILVLGTIALVLMGAGMAMRSFWGISKEDESPSWLLICTAIDIAAFIGLLYLADIKSKARWAKFIRPAGTSTLTCYLLPSIHYAILNLLPEAWRLPLALRTGNIGIIKSLLYSLLIIRIAGWLEKKGIRLAL